MDLTNTRSLILARQDKEIGQTFKRIDDLISAAKVKKVTLSPKVYNKIISYFPAEMKRRIGKEFEYKEAVICPLP